MTLAVVFTDPRGLWALALAAPLIALHLYRKRRRRIEVAFVPLLRESVGATQAFGWFRRVAEALALFLRLLALACLALALAGPQPAGAATPPEDLVIVIDADETAQTIEARGPRDERRIDREVALASAHLRAHVGGKVAVVVAEATPRVAVAPTEDRAAAASSNLGSWKSFGTTDLAAAIDVARTLSTVGRPARILVISSRPVPAGTPEGVVFEGAGTASDDQGFVDQSVVPAADGTRWSVKLTVRNFSAEPRTRRLHAGLDTAKEEVFSEDVVLEARASKTVAFDVLPPRGGALLVAGLEGDDALPGNSVTAAFLAPFLRPTVLVVHGGTPRSFVTAFLDAMGDHIDREGSGSVLAADLAKAAPRDVTIVDGVGLPPSALKKGAWIFLAPFPQGGAPDRMPFTVGKSVKDPLVWRVDATNPLLRGVNLSTAFVVRGSAIGGEGSRGLAFAEGEAVVAEGEKDGARWMAFGLDPDGSDLPVRAALPILLRNAVRRLAVAPARPLKPFYRAGEEIRPQEGVTDYDDAEFNGSSELRRSVLTDTSRFHNHDQGWVVFDSFHQTGVWPTGRLGWPWVIGMWPPEGSSLEPVFTATVDLDPARDITPARPAAVPPPPVPPTSSEDETAARWRRWLLLGAAVLLLLDLAAVLGGARKVARPSVRA